MHISLTPKLESRVKAKVETGLYNNTNEVIRFMETHEDWIHEIKLTRLREQLKLGADQLDGAEGIAIESKVALDAGSLGRRTKRCLANAVPPGLEGKARHDAAERVNVFDLTA